jgi:ankyrin repeat protein
MATFGLIMNAIPSDPSDATNLFIQAGDGNLAFVQANLPALGLNHSDENGYTCLHAAASYAHMDMLRWLVEQGADVNVADSDGDTPLHHCEKQEVAAYLISAGADHQRKNGEGKMPMQAKMEDMIQPTSEDYDSDDEDQVNAKTLMGYFMTLSYDESTDGAETSPKRTRQ